MFKSTDGFSSALNQELFRFVADGSARQRQPSFHSAVGRALDIATVQRHMEPTVGDVRSLSPGSGGTVISWNGQSPKRRQTSIFTGRCAPLQLVPSMATAHGGGQQEQTAATQHSRCGGVLPVSKQQRGDPDRMLLSTWCRDCWGRATRTKYTGIRSLFVICSRLHAVCDSGRPAEFTKHRFVPFSARS